MSEQNVNNSVPKPNSDPRGVIRFGLSVLTIVFGIFFGWMAMAPLATSVVASGQLSADVNKKTVQHLEGGIVKQILVKEGDYVKKGQPLIILDDTQIKSTLKTLQSQYLETIATIARLKAQEQQKLTIDFPKELMDKKDLPEVQNIINGQKKILATKIKSLKEETEVMLQRVSQYKNQIDGLQSTIKSNTQRVESLQKDIDEQEELFKAKLVDIQRLRELKRQKMQLDGEIQRSQSEILRLQASIKEAQSTKRLKEKEFYNEIANKLADARVKAIDLQSKIEATKDKLNRITIVSPTSGYVNGLQVHTVGGVISPSKPIMDIVPKDSDLFILAQVQIQDIDKLKIGLLADTRFSAFDTRNTKVIESKIVNISADAFTNQKTGMPYYEVKLKLTKKGKEQVKGYGFDLVPGMPAEIMIKVGDRTALSYLLKPFMDMLSRSFNEE